MSAYESWQFYNVLEEHVIEDLQTDAELASGGTYQVNQWAQEIADTAQTLRDDYLPRVACEVVSLRSEDYSTIAGNMIRVYGGIVEVIAQRGSLANRLSLCKAIAARIERRLSQAYQVSAASPPDASCKQLQDVTADLEGALTKSIVVRLDGTEIAQEPFGGVERSVAAIGFSIEVEFAIPED